MASSNITDPAAIPKTTNSIQCKPRIRLPKRHGRAKGKALICYCTCQVRHERLVKLGQTPLVNGLHYWTCIKNSYVALSGSPNIPIPHCRDREAAINLCPCDAVNSDCLVIKSPGYLAPSGLILEFYVSIYCVEAIEATHRCGNEPGIAQHLGTG